MIEIIIALAIIGILSSVLLASTGTVRTTARDNKRIADMKTIQLGLALYYEVYRTYPAGNTVSVLTTALVTDRFLPAIPTDPKAGQGWTYEYKYPSTNNRYCLGVRLESAPIPSDNKTCDSGGADATYKVAR